MPWKGPYEDGITQSLIDKFLECPYRFYLYAILGLEESKELHPNLVWGDTFHKGLEHIVERTETLNQFTSADWEEIDQAVTTYMHKEYPLAPPTFLPSIKRMLRLYDDSFKTTTDKIYFTEQVFKDEIVVPGIEQPVVIRGKYDGLSSDNQVLVEHKCKGKLDKLGSRAETPFDKQVLLYCYVSGARDVIYDIIRIPDTQYSLPPRRMGQKPSSYVTELYDDRAWGDFPIVMKRNLWVDQFRFEINDSRIYHFLDFQLYPLIKRIVRWWEHVTDPNFNIDDPACYNDVFYITPVRHFDPSNTEYYMCNYYNLLTNQIELEDLTPVRSYFPELEGKCTE